MASQELPDCFIVKVQPVSKPASKQQPAPSKEPKSPSALFGEAMMAIATSKTKPIFGPASQQQPAPVKEAKKPMSSFKKEALSDFISPAGKFALFNTATRCRKAPDSEPEPEPEPEARPSKLPKLDSASAPEPTPDNGCSECEGCTWCKGPCIGLDEAGLCVCENCLSKYENGEEENHADDEKAEPEDEEKGRAPGSPRRDLGLLYFRGPGTGISMCLSRKDREGLEERFANGETRIKFSF